MSNDNPNAWKRVRVDDMRDWYQDRAAYMSLRTLAEACGVGASTLHNFLRGSVPHPRTRRVLANWYLQNAIDAPRSVVAALDALLFDLPGERTRDARRGVLRAVADVYRSAGVEPPPWTK